MTTLTFPPLGPSVLPGTPAKRYPHVEHKTSSGRIQRFGTGNVRLDGEIPLQFSNTDTATLLLLFSFWRLTHGTSRAFAIPASLFPSLDASTKALLLVTAWKFKSAPTVREFWGGQAAGILHTVEFVIVAQPRRVLSPVGNGMPQLPVLAPGAQWKIVGRWRPGLAGINVLNVPGAAWASKAAWFPGKAQVAGDVVAPGAAWTATASWNSGSSTTPGATWRATVTWIGGAASVVGTAPGAAWAATASWTGGGASLSLQTLPGAKWTSTGAWAPGAPTLSGGTAPSAAWTATGGWAPGAAGLSGGTAPGATWAATGTWAPGAASTGPAYNEPELLITGDGTNNSTNIIDESVNSLTIVRHGDPLISTAAYHSGTASVRFFEATTDALEINSSILTVGSDDFYFEGRVKFLTQTPVTQFFVHFNHNDTAGIGDASYLRIGQQNGGKLRFFIAAKTTDNLLFYAAAEDVVIDLTAFNHYAAARVNGQLAVWVNGIFYQQTMPFTPGGPPNTTGQEAAIGTRTIQALGNRMYIGSRRREGYFDNGINAYLDKFIFQQGTPPWGTGNFTPS
jgi:hypothetical protein